MNKQILLPAAIRKEMTKTFRSSRSEVGRALKYERNSSRAQMLRAAALERGGLIYTGAVAPAGFTPDVETSFDRITNQISQTFVGGRVEIRIALNSSVATLYVDGTRVADFSHFTTADWSNVVYNSQKMLNQLNS